MQQMGSGALAHCHTQTGRYGRLYSRRIEATLLPLPSPLLLPSIDPAPHKSVPVLNLQVTTVLVQETVTSVTNSKSHGVNACSGGVLARALRVYAICLSELGWAQTYLKTPVYGTSPHPPSASLKTDEPRWWPRLRACI